MANETLFNDWASLLAGIFVMVSLFSWYRKRDPLVCRLTSISVAKTVNFFNFWQLEAISTVGFSDPILSYFSALRFYVDAARMFKGGYKSVSGFSDTFSCAHLIPVTMRLGPTRVVQGCQLVQVARSDNEF